MLVASLAAFCATPILYRTLYLWLEPLVMDGAEPALAATAIACAAVDAVAAAWFALIFGDRFVRQLEVV